LQAGLWGYEFFDDVKFRRFLTMTIILLIPAFSVRNTVFRLQMRLGTSPRKKCWKPCITRAKRQFLREFENKTVK